LIDLLPPSKLGAVRHLLEVMLEDREADDLTDEDRQALRASKDYFQQGGQGVSFDDVVAGLGLTMDQVRDPKTGQ